MKKAVTCLMILLGLSAFADDKNDALEHKIESEVRTAFGQLKDGATIIEVWDISIDLERNRTDVDVELPEGTKTPSKAALQAYAKDLAEAVKKSVGTTKPVYVEIGTDDAMFDKKLLKEKF